MSLSPNLSSVSMPPFCHYSVFIRLFGSLTRLASQSGGVGGDTALYDLSNLH